MDLGKILGDFKKSESAESIIPLVDSEELRNGVVAWKSIVVTYKKMTDCKESDEAAKWEWMWTQIDFDVRNFGIVAGVSPQYAANLYMRLKGLRLIYPDGTINSIAAKYLVGLVMAKLPKPPKPPKPKSPETPPKPPAENAG